MCVKSVDVHVLFAMLFPSLLCSSFIPFLHFPLPSPLSLSPSLPLSPSPYYLSPLHSPFLLSLLHSLPLSLHLISPFLKYVYTLLWPQLAHRYSLSCVIDSLNISSHNRKGRRMSACKCCTYVCLHVCLSNKVMQLSLNTPGAVSWN